VSAPAANGGQLLIDGNPVSATGWTGELQVGHHTVAFRSADTWPWLAGVDVQWQQRTDVKVAPTSVVPGDEGAFVAGLNAYLGGLGGRYGVWLDDLSSGRQIGYHAGDSMEAASVIKLPLALYLLDQAAQNKLKLSDTIQLEDSDFMGGTGTLYYSNAPGDTLSYQDLLGLLIQQSDNTAWKALKRVLGSDKVDAYAASIGAPDCHQEDDNCTPQEAGLMLAKLATSAVLDAGGRQMLIGLLENTAFNDRINYYLGNVAIAHKVGMDGGVMNDAGIVLGSHQFVISMFTDSDNPDQGVQAIRDVSRAGRQVLLEVAKSLRGAGLAPPFRRLALEVARGAGRQVRHRVDGLVVDPQLEVQVRPGRVARGALEADRLALGDGVAHLDERPVQVPVQRGQPALVLEHHVVAVAVWATADQDHDAIVGSLHGGAFRQGLVDAGVEVRKAPVGRLEPVRRRPKALRDG